MTSSPHDITTIEELTSLVGEPGEVTKAKVLERLDDFGREFIARSPFLVLATADGEGRADNSPKGDAPGFVLVEDDHTLVIPDRLGNRLVYGHRNIIENPQISVLFMVPGTSETFRVNGRAVLTADPALLEKLTARGRPAVLAIRIAVEEAFFHCAKAFMRSQLWKPESWGEPYKVSFGRMFAKKAGGSDADAEAIDRGIEQRYRETL